MENQTESKTAQPTATDAGAQPTTNIEQVLRECRRGNTLLELQESLQEVVAAVKDTAKKGTLTLKIEVECRTPGDPKEVVIDARVEAKLPKPTRPKTIFFTTDKNTLQRADPRQGTLGGILGD